MKKAKRLVLEEGYTQYAAAAAAGITRGAISKAPWYRDHVAALEAKLSKRKARK